MGEKLYFNLSVAMLMLSVAFLFNWIGFLLSLCISNTVAGRCGALAGLGLSIVKWVAIVKVCHTQNQDFFLQMLC